MMNKIPNSNAEFRAPSIKSLMAVFVLIPQIMACNGSEDQTKQMTNVNSISTKADPETFQELGFFGEIKEEKWDDFVHAAQDNIGKSRKERGNLSFSLYQPENERLRPIWFERYDGKKSHNEHKQQDYFKVAINVIQQSLKGESKAVALKVLSEIPIKNPIHAHRPQKARHVIVLFDVKPTKRMSFIDAMSGATPISRQTEGNLEFNLYGYADDPNKFVLIEGWQTQANQERQLELNHIKLLNTELEGLFNSNPRNTRWVVKDISQ